MIWSCLPVSLFGAILSGQMSVGDWARAARDMDLDAVDLSILFVTQRTPMGIARLKRQLDGMPVAMITTYPDFTHPDPEYVDRQLAHALSDIAVAADLGSRYIRLTAGQAHPGMDQSKAMDQAVQCLETCCLQAQRRGVIALLENHSKPGAWQYPDFDFDTGRFLELVRRTQGMPLYINFDTANTYALGDDATAALEIVWPRVRSIHVNDILDREKLQFVGIGEGGAPIGPLFSIAKNRGFDGLLSIEEAGSEGLKGIRRSFDRARALWAQA